MSKLKAQVWKNIKKRPNYKKKNTKQTKTVILTNPKNSNYSKTQIVTKSQKNQIMTKLKMRLNKSSSCYKNIKNKIAEKIFN